MSQDHYVYSTLSSDVIYQGYAPKDANDVPTPTQGVLIRGGAGVAGKTLMTPLGIVNKVSAEELAFLEEDKTFQLHRKNGFITVRDSKSEVETVVADMEGRDNSAPLVEEDFTEGKGAKLSESSKSHSKKSK